MNRRWLYQARLWSVATAAVLCLLPVAFIILNSFMSNMEAQSRYTSQITVYNSQGPVDGTMHYMEPTLLPDLLTFSSYRQILMQDPTHLRFLWNSIILAVPIVVGTLIVSPLAAYGFERLRWKSKEKVFLSYIITMLLPMQFLLVPHFIIASFLGFGGNYLAIILPAVFAPFGVFLIRQQMKGFDKSTIEAASIDGASELRIFYSVVLPGLKPTMTALMVLTFAEVWNLVDQAVVFIRDERQMPMSVHLSTTIGGDMIGLVFAVSTILMIPALIVFLYGQDSLAEGVGYMSFR